MALQLTPAPTPSAPSDAPSSSSRSPSGCWPHTSPSTRPSPSPAAIHASSSPVGIGLSIITLIAMPLLARAKADVARGARVQRRAQREPPKPALRLPLRRTPRSDWRSTPPWVGGGPTRSQPSSSPPSPPARDARAGAAELLHRRRLLLTRPPRAPAARTRQRAALLASGSSLRALARSPGTEVHRNLLGRCRDQQRHLPAARTPTRSGEQRAKCAIWKQFQITHTAFSRIPSCGVWFGLPTRGRHAAVRPAEPSPG